MPDDLAEDFIDWGANKFLVVPGLQKLVADGVITLSGEHTVEQAADLLINAIMEDQGKKLAGQVQQ